MERTEQLGEGVRPILEQFPAVQAAFLFGSHAEGRARDSSDLDIGLVGDKDTLQRQRLALLTEFARAGVDRVDLVILDGADPALQFEAVAPNRLLYARPEFDKGSYFSRTLREYFDFEPYLRIQRKAMKERLTDGTR